LTNQIGGMGSIFEQSVDAHGINLLTPTNTGRKERVCRVESLTLTLASLFSIIRFEFQLFPYIHTEALTFAAREKVKGYLISIANFLVQIIHTHSHQQAF